MAGTQDDVEQIMKVSRAIGKEMNADVLLFAGSIYPQEEKALADVLNNLTKKRPNVFFVFATLGGLPDSGYRISRMLQRAYSKGKITIFVPSFCKSAGTLVVMGANSLMMTSSSELGPLDVQLVSRDLAERTSGLTPTQALMTLRGEVSTAFEEVFLHIRRKTRLASENSAEVAGHIVSNLFKEVYGKIDPMRLGENDRSMLVAQNYAERLSRGATCCSVGPYLSSQLDIRPTNS